MEIKPILGKKMQSLKEKMGVKTRLPSERYCRHRRHDDLNMISDKS